MLKKKIVVLEDEPHITELLTHLFEKEGYIVRSSSDGITGFRKIKEEKPDILVLDLMIPGMDGLEVCKKVRGDASVSSLPILMLTAKGEESNKIIGLELGADDYMSKPFSQKELLSRVKAVLRRAHPPATSGKIYHYQSVSLDTERHEVRVDQRNILLTAKEFKLLEHLIINKGRVLTREILLNSIWGYDYFGTTRTVDVHVSRLREKIPVLAPQILSINQLGYKLKDDSE
ncbi:MAG: response regulator transcription factor [Nitrospirae bacterium]|nr:response regulator transcription factor [Nitrospirota bacterium]